MKIEGVRINNFLSFDSFSWKFIDPQFNIIVGPNGTGKTNLFHALRVARDTLVIDRKQDVPLWSQQTHRSLNNPIIEIVLDIRFTSEWEQQLLCTFVAASICDERLIQSMYPGQQNPDELVLFSKFLSEELHPENITWLFTGKLIVTYDGLYWSCRYEGEGAVFHLHVSGLYYSSLLSGIAWTDFLRGMLLKQEKKELNLPNLHDRLKRLIDGTSGFILQIERPQRVVLPTHRMLERLASIELQHSHLYGAQLIFQILLEHAFVFTDNVRRKPLYNFLEDNFNAQNIDLSNGEQLALYLYRKKNGTAFDRKQYCAIENMFSRLTDRHFDVGLSNLDRSGRNLDIHLIGEGNDIPLEFSGAGIAEALFLSTLIASGDGRVVLLDEPALTIHVTMQRALLSEIRTHIENNNQFIIVTHSPTLVDPNAITKVSYFSMRRGNTYRTAIDRNNMDTKELARLEQELRKSINSRALLFSRGVILVEGGTELGAFPVWYEKQFNQTLEGQDIFLYEVGGDQSFSQLVRFLRPFKIPWAIICDGKVISYYLSSHIPNSSNKSIVKQLEEAGVFCASFLNKIDFLQLCQELEQFGVFTLAKKPDDEIETLQIIQSNLKEASEQFPKSKPRQGLYIATKYDCPEEVATLFQKALHYLKKAENS